ncbi:hypothetical protein AHAS_Ahas06G0152400 [Arachis hypogaea]
MFASVSISLNFNLDLALARFSISPSFSLDSRPCSILALARFSPSLDSRSRRRSRSILILDISPVRLQPLNLSPICSPKSLFSLMILRGLLAFLATLQLHLTHFDPQSILFLYIIVLLKNNGPGGKGGNQMLIRLVCFPESHGRNWVGKALWLQAEEDRLEEIGPMAYYSEWVKAWKGDTSREAIQKHFEEIGEDETAQLIEMFIHQTDREYRKMMGTDVRIKRDPLAMQGGTNKVKYVLLTTKVCYVIWGGNPVYPTVNYIQDPNEVIDYKGPDFHEPTPNIPAYLMEHGNIITREELNTILAKEKLEQHVVTDSPQVVSHARPIDTSIPHNARLLGHEVTVRRMYIYSARSCALMG